MVEVELRTCKGSDFRVLAFSLDPYGLQFENLKCISQNFAASNALVRILPPQTTPIKTYDHMIYMRLNELWR